jgi:putative nucleotidyltransferase with HDIG domain
MGAHEKPTILVVDDERGPRESLRIILKPNYCVLAASSGAEALEILRTQPVNLVTLDLNMPGLRGDEVMRTLRRDFPATEIIVITGWGSVESASEAVRHGIADYLQKPFDVVQVTAAVTRALVRQMGRFRMVGFLQSLGNTVGREREIVRILHDLDSNPFLHGRLQGAIDQAYEHVDQAAEPLQRLQMLEVLAEVIEAKDQFMLGHARRTAYYAELLADRLCFSAELRERIRITAFLHDIGKVGVPEELLAKPGPLDGEELEIVESHADVGSRIVRPMGMDSDVADAIRHHHEHWDGCGYPDGLDGETIPLAARVISLADTLDAMTCARPYRPAWDREKALAEIRRCAGSQFDPELAKEFCSLMENQSSDLPTEVMAEVISGSTTVRASAAPSMSEGGTRT